MRKGLFKGTALQQKHNLATGRGGSKLCTALPQADGKILQMQKASEEYVERWETIQMWNLDVYHSLYTHTHRPCNVILFCPAYLFSLSTCIN